MNRVMVERPLLPDVELGKCGCGCGQEPALATKTNTARGWVKGQPRRFVSGHAQGVVRGTLVQRLENKISFDADGCWRWTGATTCGYGVAGKSRAHRAVFETLTGNPAGEHLHHLCENKLCVNPEHLQPMDGGEHVRMHYAAQTHCKRGHAFSGDNLTHNRRGYRTCRACAREHCRKQRLRAKESA